MKGFTIIELVISIAIFAAMTALVVARYGSFNQSTLVTNVAYDMALSVRTAQTYGLSVKSDNNNSFNTAYGIHFDINSTVDQGQYIFFADTENKGVYDPRSLTEAITTYKLNQNTKITNICLNSVSSACGPSLTSLDITYKRPNPDAIFCSNIDTSCPATPDGQPVAFVTITSSDGSNHQVLYIRKNGEISVENN